MSLRPVICIIMSTFEFRLIHYVLITFVYILFLKLVHFYQKRPASPLASNYWSLALDLNTHSINNT